MKQLICLLLFVPLISHSQIRIVDYEYLTINDSTGASLYAIPIGLDSIETESSWFADLAIDPLMVIEIDTMEQLIILSEGSIDCHHKWVYEPMPYYLYENSNNKSIERICQTCLQHERHTRTIQYKVIKKEESQFYKLKEKIGQ